MFFHVDESGNTGNNLLDSNQSRLSYGVLSSRTNVDALGGSLHRAMLTELGVTTLHASELGEAGIERIAPLLLRLQKKMKFELGYFFIDKRTHAIALLFEAVFDAGLNDAVPWGYYWTPLRFGVIGHLEMLVDDVLIKKSWDLCTTKRIDRRLSEVVALLIELRHRAINSNFQPRLIEVLADAFSFGISHPGRLDFGNPEPLMLSPNAIGFQAAVMEMARQLKKKGVRRATAITVDRQQQFNTSQLRTHGHQRLMSDAYKQLSEMDMNFIVNHPLYRHRCKDEVLGRHVPTREPVFSPSGNSIGLQIVDIYLWIVARLIAGKRFSPSMFNLIRAVADRTVFDGISMDGFMVRWRQFEKELPAFDELSEADVVRAADKLQEHRKRVAELGLRSL